MFSRLPNRLPVRLAHRLMLGRVGAAALLALLVLGAALAGAGWWWWKQRSTSEGAVAAATQPAKSGRTGRGGKTTAQPVSVGEVLREDVRVRVNAIGSMSARATAVVRARVAGELTAVKFKEGQEVKAGALLATIDPRSFESALGQAQGTLARDEALLANARIDLSRYRDLQAKNSIASQLVDTQAALVRQLEGTVAAGRAGRDAAKLQLSYTRITAPISGRLGLRQADRGNVVAPGDANGIVTIAQVRPIDAVFSVPEGLLPQIAPRIANGTALPVELWDREMRQRLATGQVSALDNAIDAATGSVRIKAAFANQEGSLFPNQFVNVVLELDTLSNVLTVPATALQNNHVYLVQQDGTVAYTSVKVGARDGDRVSVEAALVPGAQVVTDGLDRLRDGAKVNVIVPAASASSAAAVAGDGASAAPSRVRRFDPSSLTPDQRDRLAKMSPEQRLAFIAARRAQKDAGAAGAGGSAHAASGKADPLAASPASAAAAPAVKP